MRHLATRTWTSNDNLFGWKDWPPEPGYPSSPGWKGTQTSRQAAEAIAPIAKNLRGRVLELMRSLPPSEALTADQITIRLQRSPFNVRPRVSELARVGTLVPTKERGRNESGMSAAKWKAAP